MKARSLFRWSVWLVCFLVGLSFVAAGCAPSPPAAPSAPQSTAAAPSAPKPAAAAPSAPLTQPPAAKVEPKRGGELRMLLQGDHQGLDPAKTILAAAVLIDDVIFDTLVETTPDGKVIPSLAESWVISPDGLTYTFKIRKGVKFHNGREMTSADVKYSIERIKDKATASPRVASYDSVTAVETPDPTTALFRLKEPFAPLLANLSHVSAAVVPKEVVEAQGDLHTRPVGTGPFKFVEWVRDQHLKVEANRDHWRPGIPRLDRITFSYSLDSNARAAALRSGNVDFMYQAPAEMISLFRREPNLTLYGGEGSVSWQYLGMNVAKEPFKDVRVRQAIFWALDRQAIADVGRPETSTVLNAGFLPPTHWAGVKEPVYKQDYAKAKALLAEAGYPNGFKFTLNTLTGWDFHIRSSQAIQQQLKPLGIEVEVKVLESGVRQAAERTGDYQAQVMGSSGTLDPDERLQQMFVTGGGTNYGKFSDPQVDRMTADARRTTDQAERARLYREVQKRLTEIGPMAFLYIYHNYDAAQKYVKDYVWHSGLSYRGLREVWLDK